MSTSTTATIHTLQFCAQLSTKHPQVTGHSVRELIRELLQGFCHAYDASSSFYFYFYVLASFNASETSVLLYYVEFPRVLQTDPPKFR